MKMKVQVIVESDDGQTEVIREAIALDRGPLQADQLGLTLAEAKNLLSSVQQTMAIARAAGVYDLSDNEIQEPSLLGAALLIYGIGEQRNSERS